MPYTLKENAHAVLLPAFDTTVLSDSVKRFLANGGCSILLGESRKEYVARGMTAQRKQAESPETFLAVTGEAAALAGDLLVAVDQEIAGICRLHDLVPAFPAREQISEYDVAEFTQLSASIAAASKSLGVNCFLAPIVDVVTGDNPWLDGRTWSTSPANIAAISAAYIQGLQANGVAATAKHFPGHPHIPLDPAESPDAQVMETLEVFDDAFKPFVAAIEHEVEFIMTGPAIVTAFDHVNPASVSPAVIDVLRNQLGFNGVVMSDGLTAPATALGLPVTQVAVNALKAGSDYLLTPDNGDDLEQVTQAIVAAVQSGELAEERLAAAADKVRAVAKKYQV